MVAMLMLAFVQWGFLTATIATSKNRNSAAWFALGGALPVLGLVMAMVVSDKPRVEETVVRARAPRLRPVSVG